MQYIDIIMVAIILTECHAVTFPVCAVYGKHNPDCHAVTFPTCTVCTVSIILTDCHAVTFPMCTVCTVSIILTDCHAVTSLHNYVYTVLHALLDQSNLVTEVAQPSVTIYTSTYALK